MIGISPAQFTAWKNNREQTVTHRCSNCNLDKTGKFYYNVCRECRNNNQYISKAKLKAERNEKLCPQK